MTPEAQNIAIAEACPSLFWINKTVAGNRLAYRLFRVGEHPDYGDNACDPLTDLNACHEMEKVLDADEVLATRYAAMIKLWLYGNRFMMIRATAAQRCEAFLRTIGKWRDEP